MMKSVAQRIAEAPIEVREPKTTASTSSDGWPDPDLTILVAGRRKPPELPLEAFGDFWGMDLRPCQKQVGPCRLCCRCALGVIGSVDRQ